MTSPIKKVLVANRGEIALRVMRTCRELQLETVAVFSDPDRCALHVRYADEAIALGGSTSAESYLVIDKILEAAQRTGADAVHPGYGFLSENPEFARRLEAAGITLIGPRPEAMEAMGHKTKARDVMIAAQVPVVPGSDGPVAGPDEAVIEAQRIGFPIMVKAAAGGGGKGMRRVDDPSALHSAFAAAQSEARNSFGDDRVYLERFLDRPRHIEVQVLADTHGNCVHLFERECSIQRRHQKIIEEAPSAFVDDEMRRAMGAVAVQAAKAVGYVGAGTVEFLADAQRNFFFLEMNTRLQVEHPVTEWITGLDLVEWQIRVAQGEPLGFTQDELTFEGHSIEARVYAEDPAAGFMPAPGTIEHLHVPSGPYVRDDSGVSAGSEVTPLYDPMISKLSVWGADRATAIARLDRALAEYKVVGITTNIRFLRRAIVTDEFRSGDFDTGFVGNVIQGTAPEDSEYEHLAVWAAVADAFLRDQKLESQGAAGAAGRSGVSAWRRYALVGSRSGS
ncbi:MAG: acetyl-CoA carboxylase biotin carboxylase subunit [Myxococcota bacterium]|nr:acetyl-CoA carboxylase biotin carboxylase subunit [Myxococcota bacterium]